MSQAEKPKSDLALRSGVALILMAIAGGALWLGDLAFWGLATVAGLLMLWEFAGLLKVSDRDRKIAMVAFCVPLGAMSALGDGMGFFASGALIGMAVATAAITRNGRLGGALIYVGVPVFALVWLRIHSGDGLLLTFWALSLVWATDTGAYFAGRSIGGPKIAPAISPNKTWAGLGGGMLAALLWGLALHHYAGLPLFLAQTSPLLAVLAQSGDFFESWMKRRAGVKDSGTLLPGHGGVLDRLDGLVTSAPIAALLVALGGAG